MKLSGRALLRRLRFAAMAALSSLVILLGVLAGLTQLAMPWLEHHPQHVEHWLSQRLGRTVTISGVSGRWIGGGPVLTLKDVHIAGDGASQPPFSIPQAELAFDLYAPFQRNAALSEFRLADLDLQLARDNGTWQLSGLDFAADRPGSDNRFSMGALGAIELRNLKLRVVDAEHGVDLALGVPVLRLLNRGDTQRVVGRVRLLDTDSPPLELVADLDVNRRSGELYFGGRAVDIARVASGQTPLGIAIEGGQGTVQVWAHVNAARVDDVRLRVDLKDARFGAVAPVAPDEKTSVTPRTAFDRFAFAARWLRVDGGWNFDLADFVAGSAAVGDSARLGIERRDGASGPTYRAGGSGLSLEPIGNLAMLVDRVPEGLRRWLYLAHPRGQIDDASLRWAGIDDFDVDARLRHLELADAVKVPGIGRIDAELHGDSQALLLELPQQPARVDYPHVFRKPFLFSQLGGDIVARRDDGVWSVATDRLVFEGEGYGGEVRGSVDLPEGRKPLVDLYAAVSHGDVVAAKLFWPTTSMSPKAIAWLDRGLVDGRIVEGRAAIHGDLAHWPFRDDTGHFVARAEVADTDLIYDGNWPRAEKIQAVATFVNDGLQVDVDSAESMGNRIASASAAIPDFRESVLNLDLSGGGTGASLLGFLRATPVGRQHEDVLKDVDITGKGTVTLKLELPIKQVEALTLDGNVDLRGAQLDQRAYKLSFTDASGQLHFDQRGFVVKDMDTTFRNAAAKLSMAVGGSVSDSAHVFEARLAGRYPVATVFADAPDLLPALGKVSGESSWRAEVDIDSSAKGSRAHLAVSSDLRGTSIDLPAPLAKDAAAALPFRLRMELPYQGQPFEATLGDIASARGRLPGTSQPLAVRVEFGGTPGDLPPRGVSIGGRIGQLDAGGWVELSENGAGAASGGLLNGIDLQVDDMLLSGRHFTGMQLKIDSDAVATTVHLSGAPILGTFMVPARNLVGQGVTARFERIHWPEAPEPGPDAPDDAGALADVAPGLIPPLHVSVADFRLGKASFGAAEFESHPTTNGMRIDKLHAQSPNIVMTASGDWTGVARNNRSRLAIELSAQNLGHMMDALGYPGLIDGGTARTTIDAEWAGPPSAFALPRLNGTLDIDVAEGRILDVEPGAGRIFGLFSLTEIPRRLTLDFSDFFKSGFTFNSIKGKFRLADGNAFTDGLAIKSPAADILITGRTGLRARDYDQRMSVSPHAGATLPIVGAIAAGPVGAAAGLVVQGILHKPIGKAIKMDYTVTGSWEKPKITSVSREKTAREGRAKKSTQPTDDATSPASDAKD